MAMSRRLLIAMGLSLLVLAGGQAPAQQQNGGPRPVANAVYTDAEITVDGRLDEPAWQTAEILTDFIQKEPEEGKAQTERTEVRVLYNKEYVYFGVHCYDREPDGVVINDINRDFNFLDEDYFAIVLDTFNDDRNGYYLGTTAIGGQRDIQFAEEGRTQNVNWDGVWFVEGRRVEDGYIAEFGIPFNTLRFSREQAQVWGLNLIRRIRRRNEVAFWSELPRRHTGISGVSLAGELRGIQNVEPGRNLQVKPYLLGGVKKLASRGEGTEAEYDGGLDVKYGVTPGLILDLTANTDFSHVEADTQVVNLTRFPTFFAEKREFFLENSGIFQFGSLQNNEALLFHSRTIGLAGGQPIPIFGGARLSGHTGPWSLGLLNMQTRSEESIPATNFTVARLRRNLLASSNVGVMMLNKQSRLPDDHNRAFGADGSFIFFNTGLRLGGAFAKTSTPGRNGDDRLGKIEGEVQNSLLRYQSAYVDIGQNFNPQMGFVSRRGRRMIKNEFVFRPRLSPETSVGSWLRDINFSVNSQHVLFSTGGTETKYLLNQLTFEFQNGSIIGTHYETNFERLIAPFEITEGIFLPPGDYPFNEQKVWYNSDRSKLLSGGFEWLWSEFYSGRRKELILEAQVRPSYKFVTSVEFTRNDIDLAEGAFVTNLVAVRANYTFNPKMFFNSFIQYNSETEQILSNIRYRLIHRPLSDIYVVYNDLRDRRHELTDWSLTLKYTRLFSF